MNFTHWLLKDHMISIAEHHGLLQQSHWIIRIFNIITIYVLYEIHTLGSLCAEKKNHFEGQINVFKFAFGYLFSYPCFENALNVVWDKLIFKTSRESMPLEPLLEARTSGARLLRLLVGSYFPDKQPASSTRGPDVMYNMG